jgi:hemerythrin-like domain-containing protein
VDVFDRIKEDHDTLRRRFGEMIEAAEAGDEARVLELLEAQHLLLVAHHRTEERVVFSELVGHDATRAIAEEAWEEHEAINHYLAYLSRADKRERLSAKIEVLEEYTTHHLDEEEEEMFAAARDAFGAERLTELRAAFEEEEARRFEEETRGQRAA